MAEVDPRFDPVFQRGYDPAKHGRPRPPRVEERREARVEERREARVEERREATRLETPHPTPDLDPDLPPRNPFRLALLLTSLAALAVAGVLIWTQLTSDPLWYETPGSDVWARFWEELQAALIPALIVGGIAGLALWLGLGALRRSSR
jgi:hypothetical protein